jgi:integrase
VARNIRSPQLETRTGRLKLPKRGKPYWVRLARGLSLGYRRIDTAGPWIVRKADGHSSNWIKNFAVADDFEPSNGDGVLTFLEAQGVTRTIARGGESVGGIITVADAIARYGLDLQARGGRPYNARLARIHLPPSLLQKPVGLLTVGELKNWRDGLLTGRTKATVNRVVAVLSAALELAAATDPRITARPWKTGLKKLAGANEHNARNVVLPEEQVSALVRLAYKDSVEFGYLVETMAITGARRSQLARLTVADLQDARREPRLQMPTSKKGKGHKRVDRRAVPIPASLAAKLRAAAAGRADNDPLLVKPDGEVWGINDLRQPFREIVEKAGLDPDAVTSYALRHTSITRQLLAGIPIRVVAHMHDSSVQMLEVTYSASIGDHSDALYRKALPDFGAPDDVKVVPIGRRS